MTTNPMSADLSRFSNEPIAKWIFALVSLDDKLLLEQSKLSFTQAFDMDVNLLNSSSEYREVSSGYMENVLLPYVFKCAGAQIGMLSFGGKRDIASVEHAFAQQLNVVKGVVFPDKYAAEIVLASERNRMSFFLALLSLIAYICKSEPKLASLFGIRKSIFGYWKLRS